MSVPKHEKYTVSFSEIMMSKSICRLDSYLESASGAGWVLAWAVAVTLDLDVGQLGDGDDGDGGVKSDAEISVRFL